MCAPSDEDDERGVLSPSVVLYTAAAGGGGGRGDGLRLLHSRAGKEVQYVANGAPARTRKVLKRGQENEAFARLLCEEKL